jgi:tRNA nucleotidyltransferase (CCA-adding enzyme)
LKTACRALREDLSYKTWDLKAESKYFLHLALLAYPMGAEELKEFAHRLKVRRDDTDDLLMVQTLKETLPYLGKARQPSAVYRILQPYPSRVIAAVWVAAERDELRERMLRYQTEWRLVEPEISGDHLKAMGLKPGPLFGRLLAALRAERLDGRVSSWQDEADLLERLLEREGLGKVGSRE